MSTQQTRPFAIVTGASSGIGLELARIAAEDGHDLLIAADRDLSEAASELRGLGASVETIQVDLSTTDGVDRLIAAAHRRPVDILFANAGLGLGGAFLDQDFKEARHVVDTNVIGTIYLIQKVGRDMRDRNNGRILITGSIAGYMPGSFQAIYNGTKAFIDSFAFALRNELKDTNVTVTCLMPGATETEFFERAGMEDTLVGTMKKDDPAMVARVGYRAMMKGQGDIVSGWKNKLQTTIASVTPSGALAEMHRRQAQPGTGRQAQSSSSRRRAMAIASVALAAVGTAALARNRRWAGYRAPARSRRIPIAAE